jgi:hypothetical protein
VRDREDPARLLAAVGPLQSEKGGMILEGYLPTPEHRVSPFAPIVSVESYVSGNELHHFAVTGGLPFAEPFRETRSVLPSDLPAEWLAQPRRPQRRRSSPSAQPTGASPQR